MPCPCPSPSMPCREGFRMCLSHLIYTVRPFLIHTCHAVPMPCSGHTVLLKATAWSEHGMASVNQTRPHCVNQRGKTHSKPLAARHGRGTACVWHGHGMLCVNWPSLRDGPVTYPEDTKTLDKSSKGRSGPTFNMITRLGLTNKGLGN